MCLDSRSNIIANMLCALVQMKDCENVKNGPSTLRVYAIIVNSSFYNFESKSLHM
jgi:hypothetical protein